MPPKSTSKSTAFTGRHPLPLVEANSKANQSSNPKPATDKADGNPFKAPELLDLTSDPAPGISIMSSGSASIGETVDGRPLAGFTGSLGSGAGKKRKSSPGPDPSSVNLNDYDVEGLPIDKNPDQVRRQIRRFLDNGGMKVGEFCNTIGVSNNAYNRFMQQSGRTKGAGSDVYLGAWAFFEKRDRAGLKMPTKKQKTGSSSISSGSAGGKKSSAGVDISGIHLPGEEQDAVAVYDTCDEVRRKITTHLGKADVTKAQFCRDLYAQLRSGDKPVKIQGSHLDRFRGNKGPTNGATNSVYYAAYVFFEKHRVAANKTKSKHRQDMEGIWPSGMPRDRDGSQGFWTCGNERPYEDKYGRVSFH